MSDTPGTPDWAEKEPILNISDLEMGRCPAEWEGRSKSICNPHRCDKIEGHLGRHQCDCGLPHNKNLFTD